MISKFEARRWFGEWVGDRPLRLSASGKGHRLVVTSKDDDKKMFVIFNLPPDSPDGIPADCNNREEFLATLDQAHKVFFSVPHGISSVALDQKDEVFFGGPHGISSIIVQATRDEVAMTLCGQDPEGV